MAAFRTIVAREGYVEAAVAYLTGRTSGLISRDGKWAGRVAADEAAAVIEGTEKFEEDANWIDWVLTADSVEAWEITDETCETIVGWSITGDGHPYDPEFDD